VRHRVEVEGVGFATEAQGFQRDGPAAREHVQHLGTRGAAFFYVLDSDYFSGLDGQPPGMGFQNVPPSLLDNGRVARILAEPLDELGRIGPAETLFLVVRPIFRNELGCRHQRPIHRSPACNQRPSCPPEVKGRDVTLADRFFPRCLGADGLNGEEVFYKSAVVRHRSPRLDVAASIRWSSFSASCLKSLYAS